MTRRGPMIRLEKCYKESETELIIAMRTWGLRETDGHRTSGLAGGGVTVLGRNVVQYCPSECSE